ncbi:MAG TPA: serine hydrolase domain-containing protein [Sphingobacterium sp.]|nr:serine hydrolase domain-containing protein [Sphingobacterium sp.]
MAQTGAERDNRAVYNKIEYFFNIQQVDSIYNLASDSYRAKTTLTDMSQWLVHFVEFGRITEANLVNYDQGIANYDVKIGDKNARIKLAIDSNYKYTLFQMGEIQGATVQVKEEPVILNVEQVDKFDHFVDSIARTYIQQSHTQSLAIGIIKGNEIKTSFYGETEKGNKTLPTANTHYEIGALTQTFTAVLLAELVENGTIQLEDSIVKFLPDSVAINPFVQKITFKSLANHTSGLPQLPPHLKVKPADGSSPYVAFSREELFSFLKDCESEVEPEEQYSYSDLGFGLLGELISIIVDKPFEEHLREIITQPLDMSSTAISLDKQQYMAPGHNRIGESLPTWEYNTLTGSQALKSTIRDLLRYARFQFEMPRTVLENAMARTRQFSFFVPPNSDIGLAWHMNMVEDTVSYWMQGNTAGSSAFIGLVPDNRSAVVVLSNSAADVDEISKKILEKIISPN